MRARAAAAVFLIAFTPARIVSSGQTATESQDRGPALYRAACAACHGADGTGAPRAVVGFDIPLPDFTDCGFASPEADADWIAVVHQGGRARAFDRMMPAFGEALSSEDIELVVGHLRTFCADPGWPRGELNLPRPLVTEKAYPENELVVTSTVSGRDDAVSNQFLYERRVGRRGQYEIAVPFEINQRDGGRSHRGVGDVSIGYKQVVFDALERGSIVSAGGEIVLPSGNESRGLGGGATVFEPYGTWSQILPRDMFLHAHAGVELPITGAGVPKEAFWRAAVGKTLVQQRWYRAWSPMLELLGSRELVRGEPVLWDAVPQVQVSLSTRQHVLVNAGVRLPVSHRRGRGASAMVYLLWDWFDGGFFDGW